MGKYRKKPVVIEAFQMTKGVDIENLNVWGCRFFDNETDAKKSFG